MRNFVQGRWVQVLHNGETLRPPISFGGDDIATRSCSDSCSVPTGPCRVILMHRNYVQGRWAQVLHNGVPQGTLLPVLEVTSTHGGVAVTPAATPAAASQRSFAAPAAAAPPPAVPAEPAVDRPATLSFAAPAAAATPPGVPPRECDPKAGGIKAIDVSSVATGNVPTEHCGAEVACLLAPLFEIQLTSNMRSRPHRDTKNQGVAQPAIEITMPGLQRFASGPGGGPGAVEGAPRRPRAVLEALSRLLSMAQNGPKTAQAPTSRVCDINHTTTWQPSRSQDMPPPVGLNRLCTTCKLLTLPRAPGPRAQSVEETVSVHP